MRACVCVAFALALAACDGGGGSGAGAGAAGGAGGAGGGGDASPPPVDAAPADAAPDASGCVVGTLGCGCAEGDTCAPDARCDRGRCVACAPGLPQCRCANGDRCSGDAVCDEGICVDCDPAVVGCACDDDTPCDDGLVCDGDDDRCREPKACADVQCVERQLCADGEGQDAECLPMCEPGFAWNGAGCDADVSANCDPGAPGSIATACADLGRTCLADAGGATCGVCVDGRTDEDGALRACRPLVVCGDLACDDEHRACRDGAPGEDARCGECLGGFVEQGADCVPEGGPSCDDCTARNRVCVAAGEPCGGCVGGFVERAGECVAEGPGCDACATQHRVCLEGGARCGACDAGYVDRDGDCQPAADVCDEMRCQGLGRACAGGMGAHCGPCLNGEVPSDPSDPDSDCVPIQPCLPDTCTPEEHCVEQPNGLPPVCEPRPCPDGQAMRITWQNGVEVSRRCIACNLDCGGTGETGALWPYTVVGSDQCICETEPDFFFPNAADPSAQPCDADRDGWVRFDALAAIRPVEPPTGNGVLPDAGLAANARCDFRSIDRFVLQNEVGQRFEVLSCAEGARAATEGPCDPYAPILLLEPATDDDQEALDQERPLAPSYADAGLGRRLRAAEINPLTRVCVAGADLDRNDVDDVNEHHRSPSGAAQELRVFTKFAYFVELNDGWFDPPRFDGPPCAEDLDCESRRCGDGGRCRERFGRYVIRERSRTSPEFPLRYAAGEGEWWRHCTRNRDAAWDASPNAEPPLSPVGFDFAEWSCDVARGTCPTPPPPPAGVEVDDDEVVPHGLNAEGVPVPPADDLWRGMSHHSQFKCVRVRNDQEQLDPRRAPQVIDPTTLFDGTNGALQWNFCRVACTPGDPQCARDCGGGLCEASSIAAPGDVANPRFPRITCEPGGVGERPAPRAGAAGWVAVRHLDPGAIGHELGSYERGCIDEWAPGATPAEVEAWRTLCPGYVENPRAVIGRGNPADFGRLVCGCTEHFGGSSCEVPCAEPAYGGPVERAGCPNGYCLTGAETPSGRSGFWACGGVTRVAPAEDGASPVWSSDPAEGPVWRVRGGDIRDVAPEISECAGDDVNCDRWSLR